MYRSRRAAALAVCLLLAIVHTWPLALDPGRYSRNDNADTELNEWILAWVAHQLPRDPLHLFDANIFHPAKDSLAFSEPLIVPALLGAPLAWAGASPVLVHNLVLIAGFALSAFAAFVLVETWTGSMSAGLIAGSLFAFNTHTLTRLAHVQAVHIYGLPLALLALDRLVRGCSYRTALALSLWIAVLAYTSGYMAVFSAFVIGIGLVAQARDWLPRARQVLPRLGLAGVVAAVTIVPVYLPYHRVAREQHMRRTLDEVKDYSAKPIGYLASAATVHFSTWSGQFFKDPIDGFFPGFAALGLATGAVVFGFRRRVTPGDPLRGRIVMLLAIGAAGVLLSLGPLTPVYGWAFRAFPPMQGLRAAARFGNLFLFAVAILAGLGMAALPRGRWLGALLVVLVNVEALRAPFTYRVFEGIPAVYRLLANEPGPVVLAEQPFFPGWAAFKNSHYVLASTVHWRPLMNGYSGYVPESYERYSEAFGSFPADPGIQAMKDAGVTHVMVHFAAFRAEHQPVLESLEKRSDFELVAIGRQGIRLYRLKR